MRIHAILVLLLATVTGVANGQVIERPPRSTGGLFGGRQPIDPNRTQQQLSFTFDMLGGYDDNLSPSGESVSTDPLAARRGGVTGTVSGVIDYQRQRATRAFQASARTVVATYRGIDVRPLVGGRANVRTFGRFFDRLVLSGWGEADYRPTFMLGTVGMPLVEGAAPPVDPTGGVTELRSFNTSGGGNATYDWNVRHHTSSTHIYSRMRSFGPSDLGVQDNTTVLGHTWNFARNLGLEGSYSFSRQDAGQPNGSDQSLDTQTANVGLQLRVPISRTRRMTFSGSAGATRVRTFSVVRNAPLDYVTPSGAGSARMDLGRTWAVSADVSRTVTMLEGLTTQSFLTSYGSVWAGGSIGPRAMASLSGTYSAGSAHQGDAGSFRSVGGTGQLQYYVSRCCSVVTNYSFYEHQLREVAAVPAGFARTVDRNAVRVGMTLWLPLHGTFPGDRRR